MAARNRRQKGTGGLYKRADGMWVGAVDLGIGADLKRHRKTVSSKNLATAQRKLRDLQRQVESAGGQVPTASMTVSAWLDQWLENSTVKPTTLANYRQTVRLYLKPFLGRHRIDRLARQHVRDLHKWMARPTDDRGPLSASTIHRAHRVLTAALNDAIKEGIVTANVAALAPPPAIGTNDRDALTYEQAIHLLRANADDPMVPRWLVALVTGARQGEVLGMEWDRIDDGFLDLSWQLQRLRYRHGCGGTCGRKRAGSCPQAELDVPRDFDHKRLEGGLCLTRPKSTRGTRIVPLLPPVLAALETLPRRGPHGLVFTRDDGRPIDPSDDNAAWHRALERAGLPPMPLHGARHTTASMLMSLRVDPAVREALLGHSAAAAKAYLHASRDMKMEAMKQLGGLLKLDG